MGCRSNLSLRRSNLSLLIPATLPRYWASLSSGSRASLFLWRAPSNPLSASHLLKDGLCKPTTTGSRHQPFRVHQLSAQTTNSLLCRLILRTSSPRPSVPGHLWGNMRECPRSMIWRERTLITNHHPHHRLLKAPFPHIHHSIFTVTEWTRRHLQFNLQSHPSRRRATHRRLRS